MCMHSSAFQFTHHCFVFQFHVCAIAKMLVGQSVRIQVRSESRCCAIQLNTINHLNAFLQVYIHICTPKLTTAIFTMLFKEIPHRFLSIDAIFHFHLCMTLEFRNDALTCQIGPTNCQPNDSEVQINDMKKYRACWSYHVGRWIVKEKTWKLSQNCKSCFLKTEWRKLNFRFLDFEVSSVQFLENLYPTFLQRVSIACYAERCISYRKSVRLSVRHTLALSQNDSSYDHGVFTRG